jgi:PAS domain S-box-containing protein
MTGDITDRQSMDDAIRFQASLIDAVHQAVIAIDRRGVITAWNRHAERLYGWTAEEAIGRPFGVIFSGGEPAPMQRVLEGETLTVDMMRQRKDGTSVLVSVTASPIYGASGDVVGVVGVSADITERRALEEQLRHSQKMDAVGKLAGGIAHDFNNLLTVIKANAEFLRDQTPGGDQWAGDVEEIINAATRAAALTRQLLAFSRKQLLQPRHVAVNAIVDGVAPMLRRIVGAEVRIETVLSPGIPTVFADPGQLEQVLVNLVVNSRDAMPGGGTVTIATGVDAGFVVLRVSDTGEGMDEATAARAFEPFFTTKDVGRGTGLGLSTVYGIVKQSGGAVTLDTRPGTGTTIEVRLPSSNASPDPDRAPSAGERGGTETILLVEDAESVQRLADRVLSRGGYRVLATATADEALQIASSFGGRIDLLLTDVIMPEMSGRELAEAFARIRPGTAVLLMSGYTDEEMIRRGLHDAAIPVVEKPFSAARLLDAVRAQLDAHASS